MQEVFEEIGHTILWDLFDDGDDVLTFVPASCVDVVSRTSDIVLKGLGHEVRDMGIASTIEDIVWCQCHPVQIDDNTWTMVRDPRKVLAFSLVSVKFTQNPKRQRLLCSLIGYCTLALCRGVPILQSYAQNLIRIAGPVSFEHTKNRSASRRRQRLADLLEADPALRKRQIKVWLELRHLGVELEEVKPIAITTVARLSFEKAFKIGYQQQEIIEAELGTWNIEFGRAVRYEFPRPIWETLPKTETITTTRLPSYIQDYL
jgi:hypothetical protein